MPTGEDGNPGAASQLNGAARRTMCRAICRKVDSASIDLRCERRTFNGVICVNAEL